MSSKFGAIESMHKVFSIKNFLSNIKEHYTVEVEDDKWHLFFQEKPSGCSSDKNLKLHLEKDFKMSPGCKKLEVCTFVADEENNITFLQKSNVSYSSHCSKSCIWEVSKKNLIEKNESSEEKPSDSITFYCVFGPIGNFINEPVKQFEAFFVYFDKPGCKGLVFDLNKLPKTKEFADVTLKCGEESVPALMSILSARSPVFAERFKDRKTETSDEIVDIADLEPNLLSPFVAYMQAGVFSPSIETVAHFYKVGHIYAVEHLKQDCVDFMVYNLTNDNVLDFLVLADTHKDYVFKKRILLFMKRNSRHILKQDSFRLFKSEYPFLGLDVYDFFNN